MFTAPQFVQLNASAYLNITDRGVIFCLSALVIALNSYHFEAAAVDVFENEPLPFEHPLWQFDNVLITPQGAAASVHIAERHLATVLENVRRFAAGEELINKVEKSRWF